MEVRESASLPQNCTLINNEHSVHEEVSDSSMPCEGYMSSVCEFDQQLGVPQSGTSSQHTVPSFVDGSLLSKSASSSNVLGKITVDAVHPFFTSYRNIKCDKSTTTNNQQFHCGECNIYFDLSQEAVSQHFNSVDHTPIETCIYCKTAVYEYFYNENRYYYHKCNQIEDSNIKKEYFLNGNVSSK